MLDFGDDRLTRGRPHPMIDGALRVERLLAETEDPTTGVLLLDVVLGLGSADDPAAELAPALHAARDAGVPVVVSVTGTRDDPQGLRAQVAALHGAGAWVHLSNAAAARCALDLLAETRREPLDPARPSSPPAPPCSPTRCAQQAVDVCRGRSGSRPPATRRRWPR